LHAAIVPGRNLPVRHGAAFAASSAEIAGKKISAAVQNRLCRDRMMSIHHRLTIELPENLTNWSVYSC
jgi:hypothetical protein